MSLETIAEPTPPKIPKTTLSYLNPNHPVWAMAFRPLYLLTALYAVVSILLWGFGYAGTHAMPAFLWHAHEMVWGYGGAVVVAFLLTAGATWTGQPPVRGKFLMAIVGCYIAARLTAFLPWGWLTGLFGTAFYWLASYGMGEAVWVSRNQRNYIAVAALFLLGCSHLAFHIALGGNPSALTNGLLAGLILVAGFIGLVGGRIIPFFTSTRLNTPRVNSPQWAMVGSLVAPMAAAALMMTQTAVALAFYFLLFAGIMGCVQSKRWFHKDILGEPMLWTLHLGYAFTSIGLVVLALGFISPNLTSLGTHLIAVGGVGLLTLSMMTRTALGHTGRTIYPVPKYLPYAFWLMIAATIMRVVAAFVLLLAPSWYQHALACASLLFAASLAIYFVRYYPWLTQPRIDGKAG